MNRQLTTPIQQFMRMKEQIHKTIIAYGRQLDALLNPYG
jgi:hypothetical protein